MKTTTQPLLPTISYDDVYFLLKNLHDDHDLDDSFYKDLALVKQCRMNNPLFSNSQAIRRVFSDVLDVLKTGTEKQEYYAYILKGRFWDEYSITKMITSDRLDQMPARTFSNEQKKAINAFCEVLTTHEQQCRNNSPELARGGGMMDFSGGLEKQNSSSPKQFRPYLYLTAIVIVAAAFFLWPLLTYLANRATTSSVVAPVTQPEGSVTVTATELPLLCQEKESSPVVVTDPQFMRSQGLIDFDNATNPGILNNKVRTLHAVQKGIWIGYFATDQNPRSGVSFYDRENKRLVDCSQVGITEGQNVNDIVVDRNQVVWVGMEKGGVASFNGKSWRVYKTQDGLPSDWIYGLYVDDENAVWAATYQGIARFNGSKWETKFTVENNSLVNDRVHVITMDGAKNIWVGYIENGVSVYHPSTKTWEHFTRETGGVSGNKIRNIAVQKDVQSGLESIWIATFDNGLSRYQKGMWTSFTKTNGLPSNEIRDVAEDKHGRLWAATSDGVTYFTGLDWKMYDTIDTNNIVFGLDCSGVEGFCLDDENIFTATSRLGITQSRIPLPDEGLDVVKVCFVREDKSEVCPDLVTDTAINTVIANYPEPLKPGSKFFMKVSVSPRKPYQLLQSRGDQLINVDADTTNLYGTFPRIPVNGSIESGQEYTFVDYNNPFVAPILEGTSSDTVISTWRMWMQTRLIGPNIRVAFTVKN